MICGFFDGGGPHPQSTPAIVNRASAVARVVIAAWRARRICHRWGRTSASIATAINRFRFYRGNNRWQNTCHQSDETKSDRSTR